MNRTMFGVSIAVALAGSAFAQGDLYLSMADNVGVEIGGGGPYVDEDVFVTDPAGSTSAFFFTIDAGDLDAFHIMSNGHYLVSSLFNGTLAGTTFADGDLMEYDPVTDTVLGAFRGLDESAVTAGGDWSAVTMDDAGNLYLSAIDSTTTLNHAGGSLTFSDGDVIKVDAAGFASVFIAGADIFDDGDGDVYGLQWMSDGSFLMSTASDESVSGSTYLDGDVFRYDASTDTASLFFSESSFTDTANSHDIDAIYFQVPAPGTLALLGLGGLAAARRRR